MITINKKEISSCCGKTQRIWILNISLKKEFLETLKQDGFTFLQSFYDAGMMYVENNKLTITGVFGLNELHIKCKIKDCNDSLSNLEKHILLNFK